MRSVIVIALLGCMVLFHGCNERSRQEPVQVEHVPTQPGPGHAVKLNALHVKLLEADFFRAVGRGSDRVDAGRGYLLARFLIEYQYEGAESLNPPEPVLMQGGKPAPRSREAERAFFSMPGNEHLKPAPLLTREPRRAAWFYLVAEPVLKDQVHLEIEFSGEVARYDVE
jgi:hypothetical protein